MIKSKIDSDKQIILKEYHKKLSFNIFQYIYMFTFNYKILSIIKKACTDTGPV